MANRLTKEQREKLKASMLGYAEMKSPCLKKKVSAYLVSHGDSLMTLYAECKEAGGANIRIFSKGYGGATVNCETCTRKTLDWQQDGCHSVHSEMRAIFGYMETYGLHIRGRLPRDLVMYVTHGPCDQCIKLMEFVGIKEVHFFIPYHNDYKSKWAGRIKIVDDSGDDEVTVCE